MSTKIYVVFMSVGEYSDRQESLVIAYTDEQLAKAKVLELEAIERTKKRKYSSDIQCYYYEECELDDVENMT